MILGYFQSYIKETIKGGSVQVGARQSQVTDGRVKRVRVECDGGRLVLSPEQAGKSAVTVFRKVPSKDKNKLPKASLTVYSTVPLVSLTEKSEKLNIYRLDQSEQMYSVTVDGLVADLAKKKLSFEAGGLFGALSSKDPVSAVFETRCREYQAAPPPDDWDGSFVLAGK